MFDFARLGELAERVETGLNDLDSRLEQISGQQQLTNSLLAMLLIHRELSGPPRFSRANLLELERIAVAHAGFGIERVPFAVTGMQSDGETVGTPDDQSGDHHAYPAQP